MKDDRRRPEALIISSHYFFLVFIFMFLRSAEIAFWTKKSICLCLNGVHNTFSLAVRGAPRKSDKWTKRSWNVEMHLMRNEMCVIFHLWVTAHCIVSRAYHFCIWFDLENWMGAVGTMHESRSTESTIIGECVCVCGQRHACEMLIQAKTRWNIYTNQMLQLKSHQSQSHSVHIVPAFFAIVGWSVHGMHIGTRLKFIL